jgi:acetyltransferase-like isoleucine patch superfamily enzyme
VDPLAPVRALFKPWLRRQLSRFLLHHYIYVGDLRRLKIAPTAMVNNAFFNLHSGKITVEEYAFFGYNVSVLAGAHDYRQFDRARMDAVPDEGYDVIVRRGAFVGSCATIVGPCVIGEHSVVGAGAVVTKDVPPYTIVAGVPARFIKNIDPPANATSP